MGIYGFQTLLHSSVLPFVKEEVLPTGSNILIDGNGWVFHLLNHSSAEPVRRDLGGDYDELSKRVKAEIDIFFKHGMEPVVYWDGPRRKLKAETDGKRHEGRDVEEENLRGLCIDGAECAQSKYPKPILASKQVRYTLKMLQVEQVFCSEEADQEIALACAIESSPGSVVYGKDSDFLLFRDCRYVEFGSFSVEGKSLNAIVLSRCRIAQILGCEEEALVELAIYKGNDFTKHFGKDSFLLDRDEDSEVFVGLNRNDNFTLLEIFGENKLVGSPEYSPEIDVAIEFSRKLYNLDSLEDFPYDDDGGGNKERAREINQELMQCSSEAYRECVDSVGGDLWWPFIIPFAVVKYLLRSRHYNLTEGQKLAVRHALPHHKSMHIPDSESCGKKLKWGDVLVANDYQRLCEKVASMQLQLAGTKPEVLGEPKTWFNGVRFHTLAQSVLETVETKEHPKDKKLEKFPIDGHRDEICAHVRNNRITIIHGETGCGKSSRVPQMLVEDLGPKNVRMYISQPRRIAATSLKKRVGKELTKIYAGKDVGEDFVGLRMGHGVRDESPGTRIWFCTAGYLVRIAAHHPETFHNHSHLIIDEIHERSVDTDLLCYLVRGILEKCPQLRVILMSATLAADTYCAYFNLNSKPLFVGQRRCKLTEFFLEDVAQDKDKLLMLSKGQVRKAKEIIVSMDNGRCTPSSRLTEKQCALAFGMARALGTPGKSVLIFVEGIMAIQTIMLFFDNLEGRSRKQYNVIPIHSDIPFEEQMKAFEKDPTKVKIVVATNAASSSITLTDCDNVICMGTEKRVEYNIRRHQVCLVSAWISKANAVQRAGRTARVRPGNVWRLYTKSVFGALESFDPPEILQTPLDHVILRLRAMLNSPVIPVLENVITPPAREQFKPAFDSLHSMQFFDAPGDDGAITAQGKIAVELGIDLQLSKLVIYGIMLGVSREAACIAAALSMDKLPFRVATSFFHEGEELNQIIATTLLSQNEFDDGHYSIPIMMLRLLIWGREKHRTNSELAYFGIVRSRFSTYMKTAQHIENRVIKYDESAPDLLRDPSENRYVANALRLALVWAFRTQMVKMRSKQPGPSLSNETPFLVKGSKELSERHIVRVLQDNFAGDFHLQNNSLKKFMIIYQKCDIVQMRDDASGAFHALLLQHSSDLKMCMLRDNAKGVAFVCRSWLDSRDPSTIRFKKLLTELFGLPSDAAGTVSEDGHFCTFNSSQHLRSKKSQFRHLRELCPTFVEIRILTESKKHVVCDINTKTTREIEEKTVRGLFLAAKNVSCAIMSRKKTLVFHSTVRDAEGQENQLICDLPLPARVLKNIQSRSDRKREYAISVSKDAEESNTDAESSDMLKFKLDGDCSAEWTYASSGWDENITAKASSPRIGRESLMSVALHHSVAPTPVFGVCSSALIVGRNMDMVVVDHITLLPPGYDWVSRALLCVDSEEVVSTLSSDTNDTLSSNDRSTAYLIGWVLEQNLGQVPPRALEDHIYRLFPEYVGKQHTIDLVNPSSSYVEPRVVRSSLVPANIVMRRRVTEKEPKQTKGRDSAAQKETKVKVLSEKIDATESEIRGLEKELRKRKKTMRELIAARSLLLQPNSRIQEGGGLSNDDEEDEDEIILLSANHVDPNEQN